MIPIHEAMRKAREAKGLTCCKLAKISGVDKCGLSKYEKGENAPGLFNLIALADALGISIDEYVGHEVK
jgi:transcriptional regulator with XRE-family HTH domain